MHICSVFLIYTLSSCLSPTKTHSLIFLSHILHVSLLLAHILSVSLLLTHILSDFSYSHTFLLSLSYLHTFSLSHYFCLSYSHILFVSLMTTLLSYILTVSFLLLNSSVSLSHEHISSVTFFLKRIPSHSTTYSLCLFMPHIFFVSLLLTVITMHTDILNLVHGLSVYF